MTFKLTDKYNAFAVTPEYPIRGSIKNDSAPGAKDGTALDNQWKDDERAVWEILLDNAGIIPSGFVDTALASDLYDALVFAINGGSQQSLATNGYKVFPKDSDGNKLIMQWGLQTASPAGSIIVYPIAFPNGVLNFTGADNASTSFGQGMGSIDNTSFTFYGTASGLAYWCAIGF